MIYKVWCPDLDSETTAEDLDCEPEDLRFELEDLVFIWIDGDDLIDQLTLTAKDENGDKRTFTVTVDRTITWDVSEITL